jgi:hypothetical protein
VYSGTPRPVLEGVGFSFIAAARMYVGDVAVR